MALALKIILTLQLVQQPALHNLVSPELLEQDLVLEEMPLLEPLVEVHPQQEVQRLGLLQLEMPLLELLVEVHLVHLKLEVQDHQGHHQPEVPQLHVAWLFAVEAVPPGLKQFSLTKSQLSLTRK